MRIQTQKEENLNVLTHGIGFLLSIVGLVALFLNNSEYTWQRILGISLYGISLCILYFASTRYHYEKVERKKIQYRKLDHISIYLLIAGTYSPVTLISLVDSKGWLLFCIVWGIAAFGTILKLFFTGRFEFISVVLYLVMGWLIVFDYDSLSTVIPKDGRSLLFGGGMAYTVGIIFYAWQKLKYNHVIWHVFVLTGSILHFLFILFYVI